MLMITVHRGAGEIGGNAIELRADGGRILLDLGTPLHYEGAGGQGGECLVKSGVLPNIKGLYAWDAPAFDAVLLSHAHLDHCGFLHYAHPAIPVWLSRGAEALMKVSARKFGRALPMGERRLFEAGKPFRAACFDVRPYLMDHSAFDSAAFEICAGNDKRIIYTGDFRRHGRKGRAFDQFTNWARPEPDALICEGTTLGRGDYAARSERALEDEIVSHLQSVEGVALFQCSAQNVDRLVSFYRAAMRTGRMMVIDKYTGAILAEANKLSPGIPTPTKRSFTGHITTLAQPSGRRVLRLVRPSMLGELAKDQTIRDGVFIYSLWEGYRAEERQAALEAFFAERNIKTVVAHTGGHADTETLSLLFERLRPKRIIPVHTACPGRFGALSDKVVYAENGMGIDIE